MGKGTKASKVKDILKSYFPEKISDPFHRAPLKSAGAILMMLICSVTLVVWVVQGSESLRSIITVLAKTFAFLAISFLSINFLTSTRWSFLENLFGGLDRQYKVHKVVGRLTLFFIIFHIAFLTIRAFPAGSYILTLYVPGLNFPNTLGIISLMVLLVLLSLTLHMRISYSVWLKTHRLMVLPLIFAIWHALDAGSDIQGYPVLRYWVLLIGGLGVLAYAYTLVLYRHFGPKRLMTVVKVNRFPDLTEIHLRSGDRSLSFHPGQFVFVRFPRAGSSHEMWPFSISNHPHEDTIRLSIKKQGDFTSEQVPLVREGDEAVIMGPYGKFGERYLDHKRDMIWIAGGIGITPFLSMARNESENPIGRQVDLIWAYRYTEEALYYDELIREVNKSRELRFHPWVSSKQGRLDSEKISELLGGREKVLGKVIFLCGPLPLMEDLSRQFVKMGVRMKDIVFEDFNLL